MGIDLNNLNGFSVRLNPNIKFNSSGSSKVNFGNTNSDSFQSNSPLRLFSEDAIKNMIAKSSDVRNIMSEYNIKPCLNLKELEELKTGHCKETQEIAVSIANNLPPALKQQVDFKVLKEGALLHDFGKVLIPAEILNKPGSLTDDEHKIMDLHTEIGYHLLKTARVDEKVLNIVRYHHDNYSNSANGKNYVPDINLQIVNLADKYSALTEKRVYKDAYAPQRAMMLIYNDVQKGHVHPFLFNALVKSLQLEQLHTNIK